MKAMQWLIGFVLAVVLAGLGCFDRDLTDIRPGTTTGVTIRVEQLGVVRVDIVVLVDNSGSMAQEQVALTSRFPELINELVDPAVDPATGQPLHPPVEDLNIGVISSDMGVGGYTNVRTCQASPVVGDNGCFRNTPSPAVPGCSATYEAFLARNPVNAESYAPGDMARDFTCLATLGTGGCGFEQQFKAMRQAVTTNAVDDGCNKDFLRSDSLLALIWVTDEEDCSVHPDHTAIFDADADLGLLNLRCYLHPDWIELVDDYVSAFRALRPVEEQNKIVLGMIVGVPIDSTHCIGPGNDLGDCLDELAMQEVPDPALPSQLTPACNVTSMGFAFPARRFIRLAQAFGENAYVDSICKPDWRDAIKGITDKLVERLPSTCFPRALTFDTTICMADCKVIETLDNDGPCEADPACPACPPATVDDVHNLAPCADAGGNPCEPLKRDLGLLARSDGSSRRQCLVRQAHRTPDGAGYCSSPIDLGWYYVPADRSDKDCPQVMFGRDTTGSLIEAGSSAELRCLSQLCPQDRQCGPTTGVPGTDPTIPCCDDGQVCDTPAPRDMPGTCTAAAP